MMPGLALVAEPGVVPPTERHPFQLGQVHIFPYATLRWCAEGLEAEHFDGPYGKMMKKFARGTCLARIQKVPEGTVWYLFKGQPEGEIGNYTFWVPRAE